MTERDMPPLDSGERELRNARTRRDGLRLLILGCLVFLAMGFALHFTPNGTLIDFRSNYFAARCLVKHCDPYNQAQVRHLYLSESDLNAEESFTVQVLITRSNYPPTALPVLLPIAIWPLWIARWLWLLLTAGFLVVAAISAWDLGAGFSPHVSGGLAGALIGGNLLVLLSGNVAGVAVSLCVIGAWCFCRNRFVNVGILFLAISLMLKPHDAGFVWLYFLLAGQVNRRRALWALFVVVAVTIPVLFWLAHTAPGWPAELKSNLAMYSSTGSMNDPAPAAGRSIGLAKIVNLQAVTSYVWPEPRAYNTAAYAICAALMLIWVVTTLKSKPSYPRTLIGLAVASVLTLLPVYHRQTDALLLFLSIPACAFLWSTGKRVRYAAVAITFSAILLNSDLVWAMSLAIFPMASETDRSVVAIQTLPPPIILFVMSLFYAGVYVRYSESLFRHHPAAQNAT